MLHFVRFWQNECQGLEKKNNVYKKEGMIGIKRRTQVHKQTLKIETCTFNIGRILH